MSKKIASIKVIKAGSNPDIDSDFNTQVRDLAIEHVTDLYGKDNVANIVTYNTLAAKGAFKEMCTIYEVPFVQANRISALIPGSLEGEDITLKQIFDPKHDRYSEGEEFRSAVSDNYWKKIIEGAIKIEGRIKSIGMHPCGIIMSSKPLQETLPLYVRQSDERVLTQWTYESCEELGLIKMDFLGLDTVDLIQRTLEYILKTGKPVPNMTEFIHGPMNDKETFDLIKRGDTIGIFQFSSSGMQELLRRMKAREFDDLVAANALYRPGPMGSNSHTKYADRRAGRESSKQTINPEFDGTVLETILEKTAGLIIFQEQIMQISNQIAGMTLQEGDDLRSAMGKKKLKEMAKIKPKFIQGGVNKGFSEKAMKDLWDTMEPFAKYAFNKCIDGKTKVTLKNGEEITIEELYKEFLQNIQTYELLSHYENGEIKANEIYRISKTGMKTVYTVKTNTEDKVRITKDHRMLTNAGFGTIETGEITVGGLLKNKNGEYSEITEIRENEEKIMTYDIEMSIDGPSNFIANNLVSHNSHSVAYSMNAIQVAYLKAHYPTEFMAALLAQSVGDKDKILLHLRETRKMGLHVGTVDINKSDVLISPNYEKTDNEYDILYGLAGVKAVSETVATEIIEERKNGEFKDIQDFINRCQKNGIGNRRVYQNLALAGAFDNFDVSRHSIVENLELLIKEGRNKQNKGTSLFDMFEIDESSSSIDLDAVEEYSWVEKLKLEADVIGLYLTGHPLENAGSGLSTYSSTTIEEVLTENQSTRFSIAASITEIQRRRFRSGKRMKLTIDDGTGYLEVNASQKIIKSIDKKAAETRVKNLYINGENDVSKNFISLITDPDIIPIDDVEKNSVYLLDVIYRAGTDEYPYTAQVTDIRPLNLAKDGKLPIRIRINEEIVGNRANKLYKALPINLHKKRPGDYPIYIAKQFADSDHTILKPSIINAITEMQNDKHNGVNKKQRDWPPQYITDIHTDEIKTEIKTENKLRTIDTLEYVDTGYTADKSISTKQAIEKFVGDEGYDFGVFSKEIFD